MSVTPRRFRIAPCLALTVAIMAAASGLRGQTGAETTGGRRPASRPAAAQASRADSSPTETVARVRANPIVRDALQQLDREHDAFVADIIAITEIAAPPFGEANRAAYMKRRFEQLRWDATQDSAGNVIAIRRADRSQSGSPSQPQPAPPPSRAGGGTGSQPDSSAIVIAAHLDTVFPSGTDVQVRRRGTRLSAPGVGDNARSLAVLLALARAIDASGLETTRDVVLVASVGEEGAGNLRGMRALFDPAARLDPTVPMSAPSIRRPAAFIAIDGAGASGHIVTGAIGSRRYHVVFHGPGGHSYNAYGLVNPAYAAADAAVRIGKLALPRTPKTTVNVASLGGGTAVNAIPTDISIDIDLRSESPTELAALDRRVLAIVEQAAHDENLTRSTTDGRITTTVTLIGDRPSGETPKDSALVQTAAAVVRATGGTPAYDFASTDANLPISVGIPAITIESGGDGGRAHAPDEWIDVAKPASMKGLERALLLILSMAGVP